MTKTTTQKEVSALKKECDRLNKDISSLRSRIFDAKRVEKRESLYDFSISSNLTAVVFAMKRMNIDIELEYIPKTKDQGEKVRLLAVKRVSA